jgi:hypothetical protein
MRIRLLVTGALAAALLLTGCGPAAPSGPTDADADPTPSASETVAPTAAVLEIALDGVTLINDDESIAASAAFTDGEQVLALLGLAFGSTPAGVANSDGYPITSYEWDSVTLNVVTDAGAIISVGASEQSGIEIRTTDGISVGATRPEVAAVADFDPAYDFDGDGASDYLGLEAQVNPEVDSLESPGEPGTDFIMVVFSGDNAIRINAPSSDYGDL